jgi:hypothetical protein
MKLQLPPLECGTRRQARGHPVAKVGTSKAGSTISQLGCGTSVACHGKPIKEEEEEEVNK